MKNEHESIFMPYLDAFIVQRVEQLTCEGEKLPAYITSQNSTQDIIAKASKSLDADNLEILISTVRGTDIAIYEYIYRNGLKDGIWLSEQFDRIRGSK